MNLEAELAPLLEAARSVDARWRTASDEELLADGQAWEALGRLVDARRVAFAAEVEHRSRPRLGEVGLAFRQGERSGAELVAHALRVSTRTAQRWVAVGTALAPGWSHLAGEETPGLHPVLGEAVRSGAVGIDSARVIAGMLHGVRPRAAAEPMAAAEADLTEEATRRDTEAIRSAAELRAEVLDPDGPKPREREAHRLRSIRLGEKDSSGGSSFRGYLDAEKRAILGAALADGRRAHAMARSRTGDPGNDGLGAEWRELDGEHRTATQLDFDTFWGLLLAGIRASAAETTSSSVIRSVPEVIVTTTSADLADSQHGSGWIGDTRVPLATVERISCGADVRVQTEGGAGEPLRLGKTARRFSPHQRRALVARYGGCAWPGCGAPAIWCDAHHIAWFKRDDGPTDIENGILLCSFHHHLIHASDCRWRIVVHERRAHLVPKIWKGPPEPGHRMQEHRRRLVPRPSSDDPWRAQART